MGSFIGWVVAYYFNFLCEWSSTGTFFIFSAFCCANFILLAIMVPRLKDEHWRKYKHQVSGSPFNPQPWRNRRISQTPQGVFKVFMCID
ncbi:sugar transporter ERD6-like 11 isoform X1 [Gossypium hirsutum]|uniref:Sugar transporter ERD6-like 11 isoform X1 n=1 Tax=Gossypium hirsutum TaxID=3635 RepID=A0ABM3AU67_GOSHI|nr:sugar transporter ERD6-like 11 isoform X1 [Gossypium hirsutum]